MDWGALVMQVLSFVPYVMGFVFPYLITIFNARFTTSRSHFIVTLVVCLVGGIVGKLPEIVSSASYTTVLDVLNLMGIILAQATSSYHLWYDNSKSEAQMKVVAKSIPVIGTGKPIV